MPVSEQDPFNLPTYDLDGNGSLSEAERSLQVWHETVREFGGDEKAAEAAYRSRHGNYGRWQSLEEQAGHLTMVAGLPSSVKGGDYWLNLMRQGANAPARDNPYSSAIADQTRAAQMALMQQMQNQMQNQSVAGQMGAQAMGQNAMAASAAMGGGPLAGRMAAGRMGTVGGGLMGQAAMGRMQENLGGLGGMFGVATGMRGQDLRSAADQAQTGLGMRGLDDNARLGYAKAGSQFSNQLDQAGVEWLKAQQRVMLDKQRRQLEAVQRAARVAAPVYAKGMG